MTKEIQLEVMKRQTEERYKKCLEDISNWRSEDGSEKLTEMFNERDFLEKRILNLK